MRRKKKMLLNLLKVLAVVGIVLIVYFAFFKPKKKIDTVATNKTSEKAIELVPVNEAPKEIDLPENIHSADEDTSNKTYTPSTENSDKYLISILANNKVTLLIGNDSEKIIDENSPIQIGEEYTVNGIESELQAAYCFNVDGYTYPILLLLSQNGIVTYVDTEEGYSTGQFNVSGRLTGIPEIENIYETTVNEDNESYTSAVLVGTDGQGYEFKLSMIGK